jgi:hypothetical protein
MGIHSSVDSWQETNCWNESKLTTILIFLSGPARVLQPVIPMPPREDFTQIEVSAIGREPPVLPIELATRTDWANQRWLTPIRSRK